MNLMNSYYSEKLAAENLKKCYEIAPSRTKQYLTAEIQFVQQHLTQDAIVLELGCGYGRVLSQLGMRCKSLLGIDISFTSLQMANSMLSDIPTVHLQQMTALSLGYSDCTFDIVFCIQNGISAFKVDPEELMREAYRVTRHGGLCLFSSYSSKFWNHRLEWFKIQAEEGLLGEIDWTLTKDGVIVCKDGFHASTYDESDFRDILGPLDIEGDFVEIDESSLFCRIRKPE